jgi:hypothetical protein
MCICWYGESATIPIEEHNIYLRTVENRFGDYKQRLLFIHKINRRSQIFRKIF